MNKNACEHESPTAKQRQIYFRNRQKVQRMSFRTNGYSKYSRSARKSS